MTHERVSDDELHKWLSIFEELAVTDDGILITKRDVPSLRDMARELVDRRRATP